MCSKTMNERDCWTVDAMEKYGGSFVQALGNLARHADPTNLEYIKTTWVNLWSQYEDIGKRMEAKGEEAV